MNNLINIFKQNGQMVVSSRQVAEDFEKRPADIIRTIEALIIGMGSAQNCVGYFIESEYEDAKGELRKEYLLTRDGFSLLVMGFTGTKALEWKLKYIEAFNKMESLLKDNKMMNLMSAEMETFLNTMVADKIDEIEDRCSKYFRPVSKEKQNIVSYIKKRMGIDKADDDYELVKQRVLIKLGGQLWEDIPVETLVNSLNIIDESIRIIKADRKNNQVSLWD